MTSLPFHPLANIFPLLEDRAFAELVEDIRANGILDEIVMLDGKILDGRNRYRAAIAAGLFDADVDWQRDWRFVRFGETGLDGIAAGSDPTAYVISRNLRRRHLTESQRAMAAAELASGRHGGARTGSSAQAANLPLALTQAAAGEMLNVSERTVRSARVVIETGAPALVEAVKQGSVSVFSAVSLAQLPIAEQRRVIETADQRAIAGFVKGLRAEKQAAKKERRVAREIALGSLQRALPDRKFGVIYADPEWRFEPYSRETGMDRAPDNHYPTSETNDIIARPVGTIAAKDCVLLLWATGPMIRAALRVMEVWGFEYKSQQIWVKIRPGDARGPGYWFTGEHELLLLGTRGNVPAPAPGEQWPSVVHAPVGEHSQKPEIFAEMIEEYFPNLPKIELNARRARPGWELWGLEAPAAEVLG
ncbi:MT-A70 family methyltransferase [Kaistia dalseonensis]|uniref:N6-adenosine-specific RNA methylase IME4 n=1 Tax=Kaistia dalseonensis TaxID=410840 RepID=A0ABU0HA93_9HYPH|nr:MT-A70 family methyltransferase [Kaistia dalseonensis]MCX5495785.1 MT-A70 family methyltransferase [Kaistia dalseonensis]MDQ0438386.1 N6-adenosine-specific RNA methylase IME4 [Kaistia dalseonensis]